ncbi:MAG TPA: hypothetical protein VF796_27540 [Humisphaera sp.]
MSLRYAILHHTGVADPHYDLMFETYSGSDLATWRSAVWPIGGDAVTVLTRIKDHRRAYLDFTGEISGRRGRVDQVAAGQCEVEVGPDGRWAVRFQTGTSPATLHLRPVGDQTWEAESTVP